VQQPDSGTQFSCLVSNIFGTAQSSNAVLIVTPPSLVQNGGFEAGSFASWTQSGNTGSSAYTSVSTTASYVHSGTYGMQTDLPVSLFISRKPWQLFPARITCYRSGWKIRPPERPINFSPVWNGATVTSQLNLGALTWTNQQFIVIRRR